jgi:hypothetical protein
MSLRSRRSSAAEAISWRLGRRLLRIDRSQRHVREFLPKRRALWLREKTPKNLQPLPPQLDAGPWPLPGPSEGPKHTRLLLGLMWRHSEPGFDIDTDRHINP